MNKNDKMVFIKKLKLNICDTLNIHIKFLSNLPSFLNNLIE